MFPSIWNMFPVFQNTFLPLILLISCTRKKVPPFFILPTKITSTPFPSKWVDLILEAWLFSHQNYTYLFWVDVNLAAWLFRPPKLHKGQILWKCHFFKPSQNYIWVLRSTQLGSISIASSFGFIIMISSSFAMGSKLQILCSFLSNQFYACKLAAVLSSHSLFCALITLTLIIAFFIVHMY